MSQQKKMPSAFGTAIGMLRLRREDLWSSRASLSMTKIAVVMLSGGAGPPRAIPRTRLPIRRGFRRMGTTNADATGPDHTSTSDRPRENIFGS